VDVVYSKEEGLSLLERIRRFDFLLLEKEEAEEAMRKREEWKEGEEEARECDVVEWVEGLPRARRPQEILRKLSEELMDAAVWLNSKSSSSSSSSSSKTEGWENIFVETEPVLALVTCHWHHDSSGRKVRLEYE
jgi:hypothetical protein